MYKRTNDARRDQSSQCIHKRREKKIETIARDINKKTKWRNGKEKKYILEC